MDHVAFKASLTRLRTKPVSVQIGRLDIDLFERPPHEAPPAAAAAAASLGHQSQEAEPAPSTAAPSPPPPRAYKLTDRITDGVRVEVGEVRVRLRTLGRRKCPRPGPWSPPDGLWVLRRVLLSTVDEDGLEVADLEKGWAHNKTRLKERRRRRLLARKGPAADGQPEEEEGEDDYLLFKRLLVGSLALYVLPRHQPSSSHRNSQAGGESGGKVDDDGSGGPRLLVPETPVECRFAVRRPLHDVARWLGFEMDLQVRSVFL